MSIGVGIFLMAVGAIVAFAIRDSAGPVNLTVVGIIVMLAGAAGIWLSLSLTEKRRQSEAKLLSPEVEDQYRTTVEDPIDLNIDVTPKLDPPHDRR